VNRQGEIKHCSICGETGHGRRFHHPPPLTKECKDCRKTLPASAFRLSKKIRMGGRIATYTTRICRPCDVLRSASRYRSNFRNRFGYLLASIRARCVTKGIACTITLSNLESLLEKQQGLCYYSGITLSLETGDHAISVDRRDPSLGYVPENIVLTCWLINNMKRHLAEPTFVAMCRQIAERMEA
jgi:hypothetical protein